MAEQLQKNQCLTLTIDGYTAEGAGVGHTEGGFAVFVPGAAREDVLEVRLVKVLKHYAFGRIVRILTPSPYRIPVDCAAFSQCGGCQFRHLTYEEELWLKARRVHDAMTRIGGFDLPVPPITPSPETEQYRNKVQFPVAQGEEGVRFGFYRSRSHQLIPMTDCRLQSDKAALLAQAVCQWADRHKVSAYDEQKNTGLLRHIYVRQGEGGFLLTVVARKNKLPAEDELVKSCRLAVPETCGVVLNVNREPGNRILGGECRTLWGEDRLEDVLAGNRFRLSPLSFYQVNHAQTEQLYACAAKLAAPSPDTEALDLYCGVGTITLTLAAHCKTVLGVEIIPAAIEDAKENAARNGVENVRFLCADAGQAAAKLAQEGFRPQVIVVDPPRKGLDQAAVDAICQMAPERIVYVSCDCASLARDAKLLQEAGGYCPRTVQVFDMFPRTANVETVVQLSKGEIESTSVKFEVSLEDVDLSDFQQGATYSQIIDYVKKTHNLNVTNLYIAQVKEKCGIKERENYNKPKHEDAIQPQCPPEKEAAILDAFRHFQMI